MVYIYKCVWNWYDSNNVFLRDICASKLLKFGISLENSMLTTTPPKVVLAKKFSEEVEIKRQRINLFVFQTNGVIVKRIVQYFYS